MTNDLPDVRERDGGPRPVNRPGMSGDSSSWKGWGHVRWFIEEVPAGAA
ncbi:membrane protein, partial [Mycobacterium tuberculosis NRITLD20]